MSRGPQQTIVDVTVVVPVYNDWALVPDLARCLEQQALGGLQVEFLLVDNGSDGGPVALELPETFRILECQEAGSYAARNRAIALARGECLAFTDADCRPDPDWLINGVACLRNARDEHVLVAGDVRIEPENEKAMSAAELFDVVCGLPQARYVKRGYGLTANLFVPRQAFSDVGVFDARRFSGGDAEFCRRASSRGWTLHFCDSARVIHPARRSWMQIQTKVRRVKGGQMSSPSVARRMLYASLAILPPFRQCAYALQSRRVSTSKRVVVCLLWFNLWIVGLIEVMRLVLGGKPERR